MRCSPRSTRSPSSALLAATLLVALPAAACAGDTVVPVVERAIRAAVAERLGVAGDVTLSDLRVRMLDPDGAGTLLAVPEPASRLGGQVRFALRHPDGRGAGQASARISAVAMHLRAAIDMARGRVLQAGDVERVEGALDGVPLRPLPQDVVGAKVLVPLPAGSIITPVAVAVPPLVRSGDTVVMRVRMPGLEVRGEAVASQDGNRGEIIRAVNPGSGRALKVRVTGRGEVEVVHGS